MAFTYDIDLAPQIAGLKKHDGYTTLPPRSGERYITLHYAGIAYPLTDHAGELERILAEARYQLHHDYGVGAYPDGLLYDMVILSDGTRVRTRATPAQLWHCGNQLGNRASWAVHLMLGPNQDATNAQWTATTGVFEELCRLDGIPRSNVVGHCEWPRRDGEPQPSTTYRLLPNQSECPGRILHARLAKWRQPPPVDVLRARALPGVEGLIYCSVATAAHYVKRGGLTVCGYPLRDEFVSAGQNGNPCTVLRCERVLIKDSKEFALLSEARAMGWLA